MFNLIHSKWQALKAAISSRDADGMYPLLLLWALVFIVVVPWHALNQRLPIWDSADFVLNALNILHRLEASTIDGVEALYLLRGWRPLIFPALTTPFFWLSGGQIRPGVALAQFFTTCLLATYLYLLLRQTLSSQRALIGCMLIVTSKWIIGYSNVFYAELFWMAAAAGTLCHLAYALSRESRGHLIAAGCWMGLMGALRPVETVVLGALPVLALIYREWRENRVRSGDLGWFVLQFLAAGAAVGLLTLPDRGRVIAGALLCAAAVVIAWRARGFFTESRILGFAVSAELVALAWHLPSIRALYFWAYDTSFGPLAKLTDQRFLSAAPWTILWRLLENYSPWIVGALLAVAVAGALRLLAPGEAPYRRMSAILVGVAVLMITPMLLIMSQSGTSDMRRVLPVMLTLLAGLTIVALAPGGLFPRLRFLLVGAIAFVQFFNATANGLNLQTSPFMRLQEYTGYLRKPEPGIDPNVPVLEGVLALGVSNGRIAAYTYCYRDYANCEKTGVPMFEPVALATLAQQRRLPMQVHFIGDLDFSKADTLSAQIRARGFNFVLVDMFDTPAGVNWADPYVQHTREFIALQRTTLPAGLLKRGCFPVVKRSICVIEAIEAPVPAANTANVRGGKR